MTETENLADHLSQRVIEPEDYPLLAEYLFSKFDQRQQGVLDDSDLASLHTCLQEQLISAGF